MQLPLIFVAGEAKAGVVRDALEEKPSVVYPATSLTKLPNARFYLTSGAASLLSTSIDAYYSQNEWNQEKTDRAIIDLCKKLDKYGHHLSLEDLANDKYCKLIPDFK